MAVYVDDAAIPATVPNGSVTHTSRWSHLTADTQEELHAFAVGRLGLKRSYLQPGTSYGEQASPFWHYDLTEGKRRQALALGAQPVTAEEAANACVQRAEATSEHEAPTEVGHRHEWADSGPDAKACDGCQTEATRERGPDGWVISYRPAAGQAAARSTTDRPLKPGKCPGCRTAALTYGREICQACSVVQAINHRIAADRAAADMEAGS